MSLDTLKSKVPTLPTVVDRSLLCGFMLFCSQALVNKKKIARSEAGRALSASRELYFTVSEQLSIFREHRLCSLTILRLQAPFGATVPFMARKYLLVKAKVGNSKPDRSLSRLLLFALCSGLCSPRPRLQRKENCYCW